MENFFIFSVAVALTILFMKVILLTRRIEKLESGIRPGLSTLKFYIIQGGKRVRVNKMDMKVTDVLDVNLEEDDALGDVVTLANVPAWSLTDASLGSLAVAADGMSASFTPAKMGQGQIQASVVNGAGQTLAASLDLNVLPGDAVSIKLAGTIRA